MQSIIQINLHDARQIAHDINNNTEGNNINSIFDEEGDIIKSEFDEKLSPWWPAAEQLLRMTLFFIDDLSARLKVNKLLTYGDKIYEPTREDLLNAMAMYPATTPTKRSTPAKRASKKAATPAKPKSEK